MLQNTNVKFPVVEIFDSIDGEGIYAGCLATFIRLAGCNIRCGYCDTPYALNKTDGVEMSLDEIIEKVKKIGNVHVTLTGGEPLYCGAVKTLIYALLDEGRRVNIETNGTLDIAPYTRLYGAVITMDYKTVSSGMNKQMLMSNIEKLREQDVLKIVCRESDFDDVERMLLKNYEKGHIFLSPIFGEVAPVRLVDFAKRLREKGIPARVQIQMHKVIWDPIAKGV